MASFIIPYGKPDVRRDAILDWVLRYYQRHFPDDEIIVSVDDSSPYCKSRAINRGVARAHDDLLVILDADILVDPGCLKARLNCDAWAVPDSRVKNLSWNATNALLDEDPTSFVFRCLSGMDVIKTRPKGGEGRGGIQIFKRDVYEQAGRYDERFMGWGGEDLSFFRAASTLCGPPHVMTGIEIYHLEHAARRAVTGANNEIGLLYVEAAGDPDAMSEVVKPSKVDFFTWAPWYTDHLLPIWHALPTEARGTWFLCQDDERIEGDKRLFLTPEQAVPEFGASDRPLVVASIAANFVQAIKRPLVRAYHGAGQNYIGAGGWPRHNVALHLAPNTDNARRVWQDDPCARVALVGCPKLDAWEGFTKERSDPPVVAISFHFDLPQVPETRSSWPHFKSALPSLAASGYKILGHGHPRILPELAPYYEEHGIEVVEDFEEVLRRADVFCIDHMSCLYEFAYTDRPVVVLNAPWYRRDVEHGLRYWEQSDVGVNCDNPEDLVGAIALALEDRPEQRVKRHKAVDAVYPVRGNASRAAAQEILSLGEANISLTPGGCMRAKVTNTSQTTVCRGGMVFRGGSVNEVTISNEYSLSEIRACRQLKVEVLEDKMTTAAPVEAPVVGPVPFMEPPRNICACGFVAKTAAGLKAHQRTKGC